MTNNTSLVDAIPAAPRLLNQVRDRLRINHSSLHDKQARTEQIKQYILFHSKHHPVDMGKAEVEAFLTHLAVERKVASSTQGLALSALLFLYQEVLAVDLPWLNEVTQAKRPSRLPSVLNQEKVVLALIGKADDPEMQLIVRLLHSSGMRLLYGTGMQLLECLRLRIKNVDFMRREIVVREGKGNKDRVTMLPYSLVGPLKLRVRVSTPSSQWPYCLDVPTNEARDGRTVCPAG